MKARYISIIEDEDYFMLSFADNENGKGEYCSIQRSSYEEEIEKLNLPYIEVNEQGSGSYRLIKNFELNESGVKLILEDDIIEIDFDENATVPDGLEAVLRDFL